MSAAVPVPCKSCQQLIVFAETPKGERMPLDPAPSPVGTMTLHRRDGEELHLCRNVAVARRFGRHDLYVSHFATCPQADQHRKPRPATGIWLLAKTPADLPYPCICHRDGHGCRAGGKYCPCWGRTDLDHLPQACCAVMAARQSTKEH